MDRSALFRRTLTPLLLAAALSPGLTGCGGDSAATGTCARDSARLDAREPCQQDDDCPCGAHCALGICEAQCRSNADCGTGRCDVFGRCRSATDTATVAPLRPPESGELTLSTAQLSLPPGVERTFDLVAQRGASGPVRVAARGVRVACAPGQPFADECTLDNVPASTRVQLRVRLPDGASSSSSADPGELRVFSAAGVQTLTLSSPASPTAEPSPLPGRYTGVAVLERLGGGNATDAPFSPDAPVELPLEAELHVDAQAQTGVLVLRDPARFLHPAGTWTGAVTLAPDGTSGTLTLPSFRSTRSQLSADMPVEVLTTALPVSFTAVGTPRSLAFALQARAVGPSSNDSGLTAHWRVALTRTSSLPEGALAPGVPPSDAPVLDPARGSLPTPWDTGFLATTEPVTFSRLDLQDRLLDTHAGRRVWLDA